MIWCRTFFQGTQKVLTNREILISSKFKAYPKTFILSIKKTKKEATDCKTIFAILLSHKGLISQKYL